jgi:hypothetical protein
MVDPEARAVVELVPAVTSMTLALITLLDTVWQTPVLVVVLVLEMVT